MDLLEKTIREKVQEEERARIAEILRLGTAPTKSSSMSRRKGAKRSPEQIDALVSKLESHIRKTPGERIEQIARSLGVSTSDLALPAKRLLAEKKIRTKGNRRATKYFPK